MFWNIKILADNGKYKMVSFNEDKIIDLCLCQNGHDTKIDAQNCKLAIQRKKHLVFSGDINDWPV